MGSKGEFELYDLLKEEFPLYKIVPQYPIKTVDGVGRKKTLFVDFAIPMLKLAFEFDGVQHEKYVAHFHRNRAGFANAQANDLRKHIELANQGFTLVRFSSKENLTKEVLRTKIAETSRYARIFSELN